MRIKIFLLILLITVLISACDPPVTQPILEIIPTKLLPSNSQAVDSSKLSPTGFYWPTGSDPEKETNKMAGYLASGCPGESTYVGGVYHTGVDIPAVFGEEVVAIADGIIFDVSPGGWNLGNSSLNKGVLIKHKLSDGTLFVAIYGHIHTDFVRGKTYLIRAGERIGTIGDWGDKDHLHLTISTVVPPNEPYGRVPCPPKGTSLPSNGTVSPIAWLNTHYPGSYSQDVSILAPGSGGSNIGPTISPTVIAATVEPLESPSTSKLEDKGELSTFAFGYNFEWMLTYDSNSWKKKEWSKSFHTIDWPKSPSRDALEVLELNDFPGCTVHHNLGMGAPQTWTRSISQETIESYNFRVEQWTDTNTNRIILVTYNVDEKNLYVAIEPGSETNSCLAAAREILKYSVENDFGPIN